MTILGFGTSLAEIHPAGTVDPLFSPQTTVAAMASYVGESSFINKAAEPYVLGLDFTPTADVWISFHLYSNSTGGGTQAIIVVSGGGVELFRLQPAAGLMELQYHNNTSWQTSGAGMRQVADTVERWDLHLVIHDTTGTLTVYKNKRERAEATFAAGDTLLRGESFMDEFRFDNQLTGGTASAYFSAVFVSTTDTRTIEYVQGAVDGAGAETDWTGAYTDIDEIGTDPADLIQAGVTADKATFTFPALPTALNTGYSVVGVGVSARASKGGASPANLQLAARHSTTNGFSGNKALDSVFDVYQHIFTLNPSTGSPWTFAEADAAQVGVQAIT